MIYGTSGGSAAQHAPPRSVKKHDDHKYHVVRHEATRCLECSAGDRWIEWLGGVVTRNPTTWLYLKKVRRFGPAGLVFLGMRAAWMEDTTGRRIVRARHIASKHDSLGLRLWVGYGYGGQDRKSVV